MASVQPPCREPLPPAEEVQNPRAKLISSLKSALFILSSALVIFIAFSNTLTWHLQHFWGASGNFWQHHWNTVCSWFGNDKYAMGVWGTFLVTTLVYWIIGLCYTIIDLTGKPAFALKYKIQDTTSYPVSLAFKVLRKFLKNPGGFLFGTPLLFTMFGRLLHHPRIYKYIHKRHHEWTSPIAITAIYCHPIEHIFSNLLPPLLGPLILGSHTATSWLWFSIAILSTLNAHSGFHFPFFPSPEAHDFHHLKFNQNFGVLGVLDRLHGTDTLFRNSKVYQRHIMLLSLVPLKQLYPDDPKKK
ncbi:Fatty acid hydroxylase domain-containing [Argiope bruennichi]|uniref:Fatty acid hydroxylase domain-containing n=1 Tax=Argiope bruennichi TaxID=94029 RepID=A0A8T0FFF5_ARGBR|nr:Fatty acid hydroxylase domain-containing [Argiope bruennichi]